MASADREPTEQELIEIGRQSHQRTQRQDIRRRAAQRALAEKIEAEGWEDDQDALAKYANEWKGKDDDDSGRGRTDD